MTTTEIITTTEVRDLALRTSTFDAKLLEDYILPAQRQYLRPFLGKDYYNEILTQVEASTLSADNSTLLNSYLKPALAYFVVYDAFPNISMNITNKGIFINESETSQSASGGDRGGLRQNVSSMAERWRKDAKQFIRDEQDDDSAKFPDFSDQDTNKNKGLPIPY